MKMKKLLITNLALIILFPPIQVVYAQIIYSDNDYGCGWENYASPITILNSYEIGTNIAIYASKGSASVTIMQIKHNGDYNPDPGSLQNLVNWINSNTSITATNGGFASLGVTDLSNVDMLYMTGHYPFSLSGVEKNALKSYLDNGGVLFVDDCSNYLDNQGFETIFRNLVLEMYGSTLGVLPSEHAVYSSYYLLDGNDFSYTYSGNGTEWNQEPLEWINPSLSLSLDILPSDCPNLFTVNKKGKGRLPMAILGTEDFDVSDIDPGSISIADVVFPQKTPSIEDKSAPVDEDECACQVGTDGFADLVLHFSRHDLIVALGLDEEEPGTVVTITVTGALLDGTPFEATDCVTLEARED
jgi:hypothetical protein